MSGWFDAFREDGGPSHYFGHEPFSLNIKTVLLFMIFLVPYLAFLVILPGMREKRFSSFFTITHHLGVGALLLVALVLPYWNVGSTVIVSQFKAYSDLRHEAKLGISVGLKGFNVTLKYIKTHDDRMPQLYKGMYFNEMYNMDGVDVMGEKFEEAFNSGLPFPFLKVLEYFTLNSGSFCWGRQYRQAGHYTNFLLWTAFAIWCLQLLLLALVPHQFGKAGLMTGCFILLGVLIYVVLSPTTLHIPFVGPSGDKVYLMMRYGCSFYLAIVAGCLSVLYSFTLCVLQYFRVYALDTVLSSSLDDTVGPKCHWGLNRVLKTDEHSACSDASTYISEEGRSTPSLDGKSARVSVFDKFPAKLFPLPQESCHQRGKSDDGSSGCTGSTKTMTTTAETGSSASAAACEQRSLGSSDRFDSIGTIDQSQFFDDVELSPPFSRRNFTLPMQR